MNLDVLFCFLALVASYGWSVAFNRRKEKIKLRTDVMTKEDFDEMLMIVDTVDFTEWETAQDYLEDCEIIGCPTTWAYINNQLALASDILHYHELIIDKNIIRHQLERDFEIVGRK